MRSLKPRTVHYRRKREQKTNYLRRRKQLEGGIHRLVVRFTNSRVIAQVVEFKPYGDKVVAGVDSSALAGQGWKYSLKNMPAAYLTGMMLAAKVRKAKVGKAVLDLGFRTPKAQGKVYAVLKGAVDGGLEVPHSKEVLPAEERILGEHIMKFAAGGPERGQFAKYLKNKAEPQAMSVKVKEIAAKISAKTEK